MAHARPHYSAGVGIWAVIKVCYTAASKEKIIQLDATINAVNAVQIFVYSSSRINFSSILSSRYRATKLFVLYFNPLHPLTTLPLKINLNIVRLGNKK
jgi:hypothetical protein